MQPIFCHKLQVLGSGFVQNISVHCSLLELRWPWFSPFFLSPESSSITNASKIISCHCAFNSKKEYLSYKFLSLLFKIDSAVYLNGCLSFRVVNKTLFAYVYSLNQHNNLLKCPSIIALAKYYKTCSIFSIVVKHFFNLFVDTHSVFVHSKLI